jgi:uncharacterized protein (TIGR02270 family)
VQPSVSRSAVRAVVDQHVADLAILWNTRSDHTRAPHVALRHLLRVDNRIAAHLDGCLVAGAEGQRLLHAQLVDPGAAAVFAAAVTALEARNPDAFHQCVSVVEAIDEAARGAIAALGWVERDRLAGIVREFLGSQTAVRRRLGLAACRVHGADPAGAIEAGVTDPDPGVRAEAVRTAGALGRHQMVSKIAALKDEDSAVQFWAAWSAVMLGDRERALETLIHTGFADGPYRDRAFRMALPAMSPAAAHKALQKIATDPERLRWLVTGSGIAGDPTYVPWLVKHMADDKIARLAGESFSLITGTDLAWLDLERKPPENFESGPNDDPDDPNVEMDQDEGLPWPDQARVQQWWEANANRFAPGTRYFCGSPVTREHCIDILKSGYQRQRILAAHYLCLLNPGTPLFNTSAPAWRQQRLLASMS